MKQYEAVAKTMEQNGGYATLGYLYQNVLKIEDCKWRTKTPSSSIRRIVQVYPDIFFKIKPGLWALNTHKNEIQNILLNKDVSNESYQEFNHSYYQGLLVEIGNMKNYKTFVPNQDKNKKFLNKPLGDLCSIKEFYNFSCDSVVKKAKTVDVSWFNIRNMPDSLFEIEYSTNFQNSLLKFVELQDFNVKFFIVADKSREKEYLDKIKSYDAFTPIKDRVQFMDFDYLSDFHTKTSEIYSLEKQYNF